jgi:single-strand DNA-binding protein
MNLAVLVGRVGDEPTIRQTQTGKRVASLSLATSRKYNGNETTAWHKLVAWEKTAEIIEKYVTKGSQLAVRGEISYRSYEDNNGTKRYVTEIVIQELTLLGGRSASANSPAAPEAAGAPPLPSDDIPF